MTIDDLMVELTDAKDKWGNIPVVYWTGASSQEPDVFIGLHRSGNRFFFGGKDGLPMSAKVHNA